MRLRLDGRIDDGQYDQLQEELRAEEQATVARLEELTHQGSEDADLVVATFELSQALAERRDAADVAARRQLLQILASNWILEGRTLVPDLRTPFDILSNGLLTAEVGGGRGEKI